MEGRVTEYSVNNRSERTWYPLVIMFMSSFLMYILAILPVLIKRGLPFFYYGDYNVQQVPFYILAHRAVRNGEFFWNWNVDLGASMSGAFSFYLWGSPFFWITVLFPEQALPYIMPLLMAVKYAVAASCAFLYIKRYVHKYVYAMLGGYLYAFSGFNACNIVFNHFTDSVAFFPLYLILFEKLMDSPSPVRDRKGRGSFGGNHLINFTLITAFMAVVNYYFFFGQIVFFVIYFAVRYISGSSAKEILARQGRAFMGLVMGVMLSAFFLVPAYCGLRGNSRLSNMLTGYQMLVYPSGKLIWDIFKSLVMLPDIIGKGTLFYTSTVKNASLATYIPMFGLSGVIAYFLLNRKKRNWEKTLIIVFAVIAAVPILNSAFSLFNSSYYARWFYIPVLFMSLMTVQASERGRNLQMKKAVVLQVFFFLFFVLVYFLPSAGEDREIVFFNMTGNNSIFLRDVAWTGVLCIFLILSVFLLPKKRNVRDIAVLCFAVISCIITTSVPVVNGSSIISDRGKAKWQEQMLENSVEIDREVFARGEVDSTSTNYDMVWGIPSIHCFLSTVPAQIFDFLKGAGGIERTVETSIPVERAGMRAILSARYYFENADISKNRVYYNDEGTEGYVYSDTVNGFDIFENSNFIPMGFTYDCYITESEWEDLDPKECDYELSRVVVLPDDAEFELPYGTELRELTAEDILDKPLSYYEFTQECQKRANSACSIFKTDTHGFSAVTANNPRDTIVFFSVPNTKGFSCRVDDEDVDIITADYGLMAIPVKRGVHNIRVTYTPEGRTAGLLISAAGLLMFAGLYFMLKKVNKND